MRIAGIPGDMESQAVTVLPPASPAVDYLDGIDAIAAFLTETLGRTWTSRQVRYARERGSLPIRQKETLGIYAFRSELLAALKAPDSLPQTAGGRA